jgi:predicted nucleotidyltransferase
MQTEIIKKPIKVGNSVAVLIPKKYENSTISINILNPNPIMESYEILSKRDLLKDTLGIYLTGSYARGDYDFESDIDIIAVTNNTKMVIKEGKYEINCIPKQEIEKQNQENIITKVMIKEAKPILNQLLLKELKKIKITEKQKKEFLEKTQDFINKMRNYLKEIEVDYLGTQELIIYSTLLRLRTLEYLKENYSKEEIIRKVSKEIYKYYVKIKNNQEIKKKIPIEKLNDCINILEKELKQFKK